MDATDWNQRYSGGNVPAWDLGRPSPVVLRLLPVVHHPPARVLLPGCGLGHDAKALDNRGYRVTAMDLSVHTAERARAVNGVNVTVGDFLNSDLGGAFDLLVEHTLFCTIAPGDRDRYVAAAARALRPGGKIFGAFLNFEGKTVAGPLYGTNASDLLHRFSPHFEVEQLAPSGFVFHSGGGAANGGADIPQLEAVFVRR